MVSTSLKGAIVFLVDFLYFPIRSRSCFLLSGFSQL